MLSYMKYYMNSLYEVPRGVKFIKTGSIEEIVRGLRG